MMRQEKLFPWCAASCFLLFVVAIVTCQGASDVTECHVQGTCRDCIGKPQCAWCYQEGFIENSAASYRCDSIQNLRKKGCDEKNISNPETQATVIKNEPVGSNFQVQPQEVTLKLRPGSAYKLRLTVRPAENYPVDLYYLMDMSWSMRDDLMKLKGLAGKIAESMKNITTRYRLGFGSFVDKTVMPYIQPELIREPCYLHTPGACVATYGFKHILSLVNNRQLFEIEVSKQNISGNIDDPEGGFDALMQVAVCEQQIGWLKKGTSRRLVVFVSDASFHLAGDGKLGGIVTPNDEKCHLSKAMEYQKTNEMDYPSVAQLHDQLQQHQIQPIFAVTRNVSHVYRALSSMWNDIGAVTGELALDSRNVVDLIADSYNKIASTVKLTVKPPAGVQAQYTANCGNQILNQKECTEVGIGEKVYFDVSVGIERCTAQMRDKKREKLPIRVPGFGSVTLNLEYICQCACEGLGYKEENSSKCSHGNGTYACGQCDCYQGRYGEKCECDSPFDQGKDQGRCKVTNSTEEVCSGAGQCVCGRCVCNAGRYGDKCQCSDVTCQRYQKQLCGGPERGDCVCGECRCKTDYLGSNCGELNCQKIQNRCRNPDLAAEEGLCGGTDRGTCSCGECKCNQKYSGKYCERCPTCEGGICSRSRDCVACTTIDKQPLDECKAMNRCEPAVTTVSLRETIIISTESHQCEAPYQKCKYHYTYEFDDLGKTYKLVRKRTPECPKPPPPPPILEIVLGVIGGILLAGIIALLAWKVYVTRMDKREVQAFLLERTRAQWQKEKSPLYKEPTTTFTNPAYAIAPE